MPATATSRWPARSQRAHGSARARSPRGIDMSPALFAPAADQLTVLSKSDLSA